MNITITDEENKTYRISSGRVDDIPQAYDLIDEFCKESLEEYGINLNRDIVASTIERFVEYSYVMRVEGKLVGLIAGFIAVNPISGNKYFHEQMWYVSKPYRKYGIKLLRSMEIRCMSEGIKTFVLIHMGNLKPEKMRGLYEHLGYQFLEAHYVKNFD